MKLPDGSSQTLLWLVRDYLEHLEHHLRQLFPENKSLHLPAKPWHYSIEEAKTALANHLESDILATLLEHENMYAEIYAPHKVDKQLTHDQDEIYVVISGTGTFFNDGERRPFQPGDLIFCSGRY